MATIITAAFAAVLTGLWPAFYDFAPILNFIFIMAVPITWFMALTCWLSQKSVDYTTKHSHAHEVHQKKSLNNSQTVQVEIPKQVNLSEIKQIQDELSTELNDLKSSVELKDSEIERLNQEISNIFNVNNYSFFSLDAICRVSSTISFNLSFALSSEI